MDGVISFLPTWSSLFSFLFIYFGCTVCGILVQPWTKISFSNSHGWTIKKTENWCFSLWWWRRLLRITWTARRSNQSILKEISPEYSLEGLMLKLQYFGHLMQRANSLEKTLMPGKIEGGKKGDNRGLDGWLASPTQQNKLWTSSGRWWRTGKPGMLQSMGLQKVRHDWWTEQQQQTRDQTQALGGDSTKS